MKTKLRTTYLVTVLFFLFVTVGSMILFYNMFSEEFIIANNKKIMNKINHEPPILLQIMKGEYYEHTLEILSMCC